MKIKKAGVLLLIIVGLLCTGCSYGDDLKIQSETEELVSDCIGENTSIRSESPTETTVSEATTESELSVSSNNYEEQTQTIEANTGTSQTNTTEVMTENTPEVEFTPYIPATGTLSSEILQSYARQTLPEREQQLYDLIYNAIANLEETVDVESSGYTNEEWIQAFCSVYYNEPGLFWVESILDYGKIYYKTTDIDEIYKMQGEIDSVAAPVISKLKSLGSDEERVKYIHDYIIKQNNFEKEMGYNQTIYGGFITGTIQCEGYAKTFMYLCDKTGIQSMVIPGATAEGASHAWNKVKINNQWYNIDVTHDDPILKTPNDKYVRYNFFLIPDNQINDISHFNTNCIPGYGEHALFTVPKCTDKTLYYFNTYDRTFNNYNSAIKELKKRTIEAVKKKEPLVQIRVSDKNLYDNVYSQLIDIKTLAEQNGQVSSVYSSSDENTLIIGISFNY